jgi:hypothetical protein
VIYAINQVIEKLHRIYHPLELLTEFKLYYDHRKVAFIVERIAGGEQNIYVSIADVRTLIYYLRQAAMKFDYGTNAYNTIQSILAIRNYLVFI